MNYFKATSLYGKGFTPTNETGVYVLRVYTGGFAGVKVAKERAEKEASNFLNSSRYWDFRISEAKRVWFPLSYVDFRVNFLQKQNTQAGKVGASY